MWNAVWTVLIFAGAIFALAASTGSEMREDAKGRDAVSRLFRDPFKRDEDR